jgi:hypothetical protein
MVVSYSQTAPLTEALAKHLRWKTPLLALQGDRQGQAVGKEIGLHAREEEIRVFVFGRSIRFCRSVTRLGDALARRFAVFARPHASGSASKTTP